VRVDDRLGHAGGTGREEQLADGVGAQRIDANFRLVLRDEAGGEQLYTHSLEHRFLLPNEMQRVLAAAGWRMVQMAGGWRGARFGPRSALMVIEAAPDPADATG
jgi:hypothetical protein